MGLFSGITDALGITDGGAKKAAQAQASANDGANRVIREQYEQTRSDLYPYREYGGHAVPRLRDISLYGEITAPTAAEISGLPYQQYAGNPLGALSRYVDSPLSYSGSASQLTGDAGRSGRDQFSIDQRYLADNYTKSPGYDFQIREGLNAASAEMARRGLSNSGAEQRALVEVGQGIAARDYGDYVNRGLSQINTGRQFYGRNDDVNFARGRETDNTNFERSSSLEDARFARLRDIDNTRFGRMVGQSDTNFGRLADLARIGYSAAAGGAQLGAASANQRANLINDSGAALAGGIVSGRRNQAEGSGRLGSFVFGGF